jgi:hypothetical protein
LSGKTGSAACTSARRRSDAASPRRCSQCWGWPSSPWPAAGSAATAARPRPVTGAPLPHGHGFPSSLGNVTSRSASAVHARRRWSPSATIGRLIVSCFPGRPCWWLRCYSCTARRGTRAGRAAKRGPGVGGASTATTATAAPCSGAASS